MSDLFEYVFENVFIYFFLHLHLILEYIFRESERETIPAALIVPTYYIDRIPIAIIVFKQTMTPNNIVKITYLTFFGVKWTLSCRMMLLCIRWCEIHFFTPFKPSLAKTAAQVIYNIWNFIRHENNMYWHFACIYILNYSASKTNNEYNREVYRGRQGF